MWLGRIVTVYCLVMAGWIRATRARRPRRTVVGDYPLCPRGCASCSSVNGCVTCHIGHFLFLHRDGIRQTGVCLSECPLGYYGHRKREVSRCAKCAVPHCDKCFSRSYCTRCSAPFVAHKGECVNSCPAGLHYAQYSQECLDKVDCTISQWSTWDLCRRNRQTCGYKYGTQSRARAVIQAPSPNGETCPETIETRRCRLIYRYCTDLIENRSEPPKNTIPSSKKKRTPCKKIKNSKKRKKCRERRKKQKNKDRHRKKNSRQRSGHRKEPRKHERSRSREPNELPVTLPDIETNEISALDPSV